MRIGHVYPALDKQIDLFVRYSKHEFVDQFADDGCDFIYCGSSTQIMRAWGVKLNVLNMRRDLPLVSWVWDLPLNWRGWCRTDEEHDDNAFRDSEMSMRLSLLWKCKAVICACQQASDQLKLVGIPSRTLKAYIDVDGIDRVKVDNPHQKRVIQISRYALNKRFDLTIKAWAKLQDEYPDWELMFIGGGDVKKYKMLAEEAGLKKFDFREGVGDTERIKLMRESRVLVQPSVHEGVGFTPIEAQRCGLWTVVSNLAPAVEYDYGDYYFKKDHLEGYVELLSTAMSKDEPKVCRYRDELTPKAYAERWDAMIGEVFA